jgi:hypothetical protein
MAQEQETIKKNSPWLGIGAVLAAIGASGFYHQSDRIADQFFQFI